MQYAETSQEARSERRKRLPPQFYVVLCKPDARKSGTADVQVICIRNNERQALAELHEQVANERANGCEVLEDEHGRWLVHQPCSAVELDQATWQPNPQYLGYLAVIKWAPIRAS